MLGYARGHRPFRFRSPDFPRGRWIRLPAFGWSRFDTRPGCSTDDVAVLVGEGLHGRLDRPGRDDVHAALARVNPLCDAVVEHAGGRARHAAARSATEHSGGARGAVDAQKG